MVNETYHPRYEPIHGYNACEHPFYTTWASMKVRCRNQNDPSFENYGARGITYCDRWKHFANFAHDMWPRASDDLTLERIDNEKGYEPGNCVWANRTTQCLNRRKFKNNTTGLRGVIATKDGRFNARHDRYGVRYNLGRFDTIEEAGAARDLFSRLMDEGDPSAFDMIERRARCDSSVGIRGISAHHKAGYLVRRTVGGKRLYLGYAVDLPKAVKILEEGMKLHAA